MTHISAACLLFSMAAMAATTSTTTVAFNKDVLPILQKNSQTCHQPGEAARSGGDINALVSWAGSGAPEGDARDKPQPVHFVEGWNIGNPDLIFEMPRAFDVPATGTIEYQYVVLPTGFTKDTWVTAAEVRLDNRQVVHHVIAFVRPAGSSWLKDAEPGVPFVSAQRDENGAAIKPEPRTGIDPQRGDDRGSAAGGDFLAGYAPGLQPQEFTAGGAAMLIPAGSANNPSNPNPKVTVRRSDQSWEEMMIGWFRVIVKADADSKKVVGRQGSSGD